MIESRQTAKEIFQDIMANPKRKAFGFGAKAALINIDLQKAYTRPDLFSTAYTTDPNQITHINTLAELCRQLNWPVIWTSVSYQAGVRTCIVGRQASCQSRSRRLHYKKNAFGIF